MTPVERGYLAVESENAREVPVRVAVAQEEEGFAVEVLEEPTAMTFPHLIVREGIALLSLSLVLVLLSLLFDAPLEEIANPDKTPNPAKAPWYFLGLQELLHYYPPFVAGVLLPSLVVVALMIVPYFDINLNRKAVMPARQVGRATIILAAALGISAVFYVTAQHPVWPLIIPTLLIALLMALPGFLGAKAGLLRWLSGRSLPFYVFLWFVVATVVLTVIGTLFRGPGWSFTLPWRDGIY